MAPKFSIRPELYLLTHRGQVLFLPEASDYIAGSFQESLSLAKPVAQSPFVLGLQSAAKEYHVAIQVGIHAPVPVQSAGSSFNPAVSTTPEVQQEPPPRQKPTSLTKLLNRSIWIKEDGTILSDGTYDKLHLFDYANLQESTHTQAGSTIIPPFDTPVGRVGSLVCFDLRFPEPSLRLGQPSKSLLAQGFRPAHVITYPSAFTVPTGQAHWEVLLRARAIESQVWVVAAAQVGAHNEKRVSYGHSMVIDPWGKVVCRLGGVNEDGKVQDGAVGSLGLVDIDVGEWERVRRQMPLTRRT